MATSSATCPTRIGDSAVVLGASMAGVCAARVFADRFEHVTVLDRDTLPDAPTWRNQVPQGRHPHLLLAAGARLLEGWFPGIIDELWCGLSIPLRTEATAAHLLPGGAGWRYVDTEPSAAVGVPIR